MRMRSSRLGSGSGEPASSRAGKPGSTDALPSHEGRIRIARGRAGPHSPTGDLRDYSAEAATAWFYRQIERLGAGEEPERR
ncbi:MAG: hypothetical protein R6T93_09220, partial [Trueperaceae bacterium]